MSQNPQNNCESYELQTAIYGKSSDVPPRHIFSLFMSFIDGIHMIKMQTILVSLFLVILVGVGCSSPESAQEVKKQTIDRDNAVIFDLSQKCSDSAQRFFKNKDYEPGMSFTSHYNKNLNKCFISIQGLQQSKAGYILYKELYDALEGNNYAFFANNVSNKSDFPPLCYLYPTGKGNSVDCSSSNEYDIFIDRFMNDNENDPLHLFD